MAEEQIIIEVVVDNSAAQKALTANTKAVDDLTNSNKVLRQENAKLGKEYDKNSTEINRNNKQIAQNNVELTKAKQGQKAAAQQIKATNNSLNAQKAALAANKKAIGDINTSTAEGKKRFKELESAIIDQTASLRAAENAQGTFTRGVGDYGDALNSANPAIGGAIEGFQGMTKSALAFIATPLGAVLAAITAAIALVSNAMNRNEESSNKMNKVIGKLSSIFSFLLKALEPVGEFLIDTIVVAFDLAAKAADDAISVISSGLSLLGFDEAAKDVDNFADSVSEFVEGAGELADMEAELVKAQRIAQKVMLDFQKEAEVLRQIRDDETLSFQKRIAANRELGQVLNRQLQEEKAIAQLGLDVANERIKIEGETVENLDARAEALTNISDIEERITGQRSEQLVNENSLIRDQKAANKEASDAKISQEEAEAAAEIEKIKKVEAAKKKQEEADAERRKKEKEQKDADDQAFFDRNDAIRAREREQEKLDEKEKLDIAEATADAEVALASSVFGAVATFAEEGTIASKIAGIAQVGISTAQGIIAAFANPLVPFPLQAAQAGIVGGIGAAQSAKIAGIFENGGITKFADGGLAGGGMFEGASHANGGIKFAVGGKIHEAEGGEAIINKRSTAMFKPLLSSLNAAGGGKKFASGGIPLAASSTAGIDSAMAGENAISNQIKSQVPAQVAVTDINRTQSSVSVKQSRATI